MRQLPIFISSTFVDFFSERDSIMRVVRVALDDRIRHLGCEVEIIDLRWGLNLGKLGEEQLQDRVLDVCVSEVRRAAPLFLGLVGHRYGWRPTPERAADLAARLALEPTVVSGLSVTAFEQHEGIRLAGRRCIVLLREPGPEAPVDWFDDDLSMVTAHRDWLAASGATCARYTVSTAGGLVSVTSLREFEQLVIDLLAPVVVERAVELTSAQNIEPHIQHRDAVLERSAAAAFGREADARRLAGTVSAGRAVCLFGPPGSGNTTLTGLVSAALGSDGARTVLVGPEFGVVDGDDLDQALSGPYPDPRPVLLDGAERLVAGSSGDALDCLVALVQGHGAMITTSDRPQAERLAAVGCEVVVVAPLEPDAMVSVAVSAAERRGKVLPDSILEVMRGQRRSPRWVHLAVSELLASENDGPVAALTQAEIERELTERFCRLGPTDEALVAMAIERARSRIGQASTDRFLGLLACSRLPLAVSDLASLTQLTTLEVLELRYLCDELLAFSADEQLLLGGPYARAVTAASIGDAATVACNAELGRWYAAKCALMERTVAVAREVGWHAGLSDGAVGLATVLGPGPTPDEFDRTVLRAFLEALNKASEFSAPLGEVRSLSRDQLVMVSWLTDRTDARHWLGTTAALALLDAAVVRMREVVSQDDRTQLPRILIARAHVAYLAELHDDAARTISEAGQLLNATIDADGLTVPLGILSVSYHNLAARILERLGRIADALECYRLAREMLGELEATGAQDLPALSTLLLNHGLAARAQGDAALARACHDEAVTTATAQITQLSGDRLAECIRVLINASAASTSVRLNALYLARERLDAAIASTDASPELLGLRRHLIDAAAEMSDDDMALATSAFAFHLEQVRAKYAIDSVSGMEDELELANALHARGTSVASTTAAGPDEEAREACLEALAIYRRHRVAELTPTTICCFAGTLRNLAVSTVYGEDVSTVSREDLTAAADLLDEGIELVHEWTSVHNRHRDLDPIHATLLCDRSMVIPDLNVTPAVVERAANAVCRAAEAVDDGTADWVMLRSMARPMQLLEAAGADFDPTWVTLANFATVLTVDSAYAELVGTFLRDTVARIADSNGSVANEARAATAKLTSQLVMRAAHWEGSNEGS